MRAVASALHLPPFDQPWFPVFGGGERGVGFEAVRFWKFLLRIFKFEKGSPGGPFFCLGASLGHTLVGFLFFTAGVVPLSGVGWQVKKLGWRSGGAFWLRFGEP